MVSHYENNYGGAVKHLNAIEETLAALDFASTPVFTVNGLKREQLIAMNSMILHELYFAGLGASDMPSTVRDALARDHMHNVPTGVPLLVLDMYEHAYHMDYGAAAPKYVDAFMQNVHWEEVNRRFVAAQRAAATLQGAKSR